MAAETDREKTFAEVLTRIAILPANKRIDAMLEFFVGILDAMDAATIRQLRDQIPERFSTCGCSFETCAMMVKFINGHLALRSLASDPRGCS